MILLCVSLIVRIVGVTQEHRDVLRRGLRHVAGAVVEIVFLRLVDVIDKETIQTFKMLCVQKRKNVALHSGVYAA